MIAGIRKQCSDKERDKTNRPLSVWWLQEMGEGGQDKGGEEWQDAV